MKMLSIPPLQSIHVYPPHLTTPLWRLTPCLLSRTLLLWDLLVSFPYLLHFGLPTRLLLLVLHLSREIPLHDPKDTNITSPHPASLLLRLLPLLQHIPPL